MRTDDLLEFLEERFMGLSVGRDTRAYIVGLFNEMKRGGDKDMTNKSVVIAYAEAIQSGAFESFRRVGDWTLWISVFAPESLTEPQLIIELGMKSYDACDRIMMHAWPAFNELTLRLPDIIVEARRSVLCR